MKKAFLLVLILSLTAGFAAAGGLVFQVGAGYHSSYVGDISDLPSEVQGMNLPLGIGGYAGVGYGFGESKAFSLGGEFAPSWDFSVSPFGVSNFQYEVRGFLKWKPAGMFSLTGFGGYAGTGFFGSDVDGWLNSGGLTFGARITVLFIYAEYAASMPYEMSYVAKHNIGIGFAFFK